MPHFFQQLFDTDDFNARWTCGRWTEFHGWTHILSDVAIFVAYAAIPIALVYFILKRRDIGFHPVVWLVATFILACGFGHLVEATIFWHPWYRFSGALKLFTAAVSCLTAVVLIRLMPKALKLPAQAKLAEALRASEERLRYVTDATGVGTWDWDIPTGQILWNDRCRELFGIPADEPLSFERFLRAIHPDDRQRVETRVKEGFSEKKGYSNEYRALWPDGTVRWILSRGRVTLGPDGHPVRLAGTAIDITERKAAEEAIRESEVKAIEASRAKSEFLAHMSHELRTPMNGILGLLQIMQKTPLNAQQSDHLRMMKQSGEALLYLINDILDLSRIEARQVTLEIRPFSLRDHVEVACQVITLRAQEKGLDLRCRIHATTPDGLQGDPLRIEQVLVNLLGNAVKFTHQGEVEVSVEAQPSAEGTATLRFTVRDTGIGIQADKLETIFDEFVQAEGATTTRRYGGTGLGLAISRRLVEMMGGQLGVESEPGRGSTFHFTLSFPLAAEPPPPLRPLPQVNLKGEHVIVAGAHQTDRVIIEELLRHWGMHPTVVTSGPKALAALYFAQASGTPALLLVTDEFMAGSDGADLLAEVHSHPAIARTAMVVVTSSDLPPAEDKRSPALGGVCHLRKPILASRLLDAIHTALASTQAVAEARRKREPKAQARAARRLAILVAEDNVVNQAVAVGLLEQMGHSVTVAGNGRETVAIWKEGAFDLLLMDVQMPEMDGLTATAEIRRQEAALGGSRIPIVALTAYAMKGDRESCLEAGMDDCLTKPIQEEALQQALGRWGAPEEISPPPPPAAPDGPVFNPAAALARCGGKAATLHQVVSIFLQMLPGWRGDLRTALEPGDAPALARAAHALRGVALNIDAHPVARLAADLEEMARAGRLDEAAATFAVLELELDQLAAALAEWQGKESQPS